ncbi:AsmA family protein [Ulvibacterium marinum]|uniref:DUF748 domain-containing protein n=1 Tax=Ulvibacterium marinum TaxID=2419782 RepID=A0A3B0C469_9FLAO|nr:hypothetical protein [Ulvibacterium marinum]RKN78727.1 hypothetical protein D7Z94_21270 [Ulvibacterium marinum]
MSVRIKPMYWSQNKQKRVLVSIFIFLGMFLFLAQWGAKYAVKDFLARKTPPHLELNYTDLSVSAFSGTIDFDGLSLEVKNRDSLQVHTFLKSESLELEGLSYLQLLFNNTISLDAVVLQQPKLKYYPYNYFPTKKAKSKGVVSLLKTISIEKLDIKDGSFHIMKDAPDSLQVSITNYDFTFYGGITDPKLITQKIPLEYDSYDLSATEIFADLGKYETLKVANLTTSENEFQLNDVNLSSKYGKEELSKHLTIERDYVQLQIPEVKLGNLAFGFEKNRFEIAAKSLKFKRPTVEIYRDKLVADDMRIKPLYGKLLRDMPLTIAVDQLKIENGLLTYEEKVDEQQEAGKLSFEELNAELNYISNREDAKDINIAATTKLMGQADFKLDWRFNANDNADAFTVSGVLLNLKATELNPFLEPNLRTRAKGSVDEMYFTVSGNSFSSQGDMKMKYHDFKFNVLDKDRLKINKVLTVIGNIFVNDGSKTEADGFRYGTMEVQRESNKSFYNYLWLNIRDGMISTLTGNGKKEN